MIKAIMALHHKVLPPTIKVERPNPALEFEKSAFYLNTQARPWIRDQAHPRRASVSSFGFGGSNFHVALEEYVPAGKKGQPAWRLRTMPTELVLLSAPDAADLIRRCHEIAEKPEDLVKVNQEVEVKILRVDSDERKIGLSLKRAQWAQEEQVKEEKRSERAEKRGLRGGLEGGEQSTGLGDIKL